MTEKKKATQKAEFRSAGRKTEFGQSSQTWESELAGPKPNTRYKDRMFIWLFGREDNKKNALELYNALNHTSYTDPSLVKFNIIAGAAYITVHNDVSFLLDDNMLELWEEQSTPNPNMPVRGLLHLAQVYNTYINEHNLNPYGTERFLLPVPQFIVFYLGARQEPDYTEMKLSDSFLPIRDAGFKPCIEMTAIMLNVNAGHNKELLSQCRTLREYSILVQAVREHLRKGEDTRTAISKAIDDCIARGILREELLANKAEVIEMFFTEYDEDRIRELFWIQGEKKGKAEGKVEELAGLVHDGDINPSIAEARAEKYGVRKEDFRKMVKEYVPTQEKVKTQP